MTQFPVEPAAMEKRHRLKVLDGLRAIAILLVMGYHYFVRWTPPVAHENLYPYGDAWANFWLFEYGDLGVQIFFVISGFVISMTLFRCRTLGHFFWKRFARLFPTMLICSVLSFSILRLLPQNVFVPQLRDFAPSLTFSEPIIWSRIFGIPFNAVDGAYWSLFVEVKFYFWISVIYFMVGSRRFFNSVALAFGGLVMAYVVARALDFHHLWAIDFIFVVGALPWFIAGIGFYALHVDARSRIAWVLLMESVAAIAVLKLGQHVGTAAPYLAFGFCFFIFMAMMRRPRWVAWMAYPPLAAIGVASYSLYLLHQYIGVAILDMMRNVFGPGAPLFGVSFLTVLFVPVLMGSLILLSLAIYRYWEAPAKDFLLGLRLTRPAILRSSGAAEPSDPAP
ncbi:MAG: acyltransferase [Thiomonas sp.]|uniref:acyltransferase family protein n=1 Tax=Thiomonas sp. TaxID=2047785 RepID=UPI002A35846A|nr:acyltransferase [Thiomonas sp.]MDY0331534.1 acyltransferase [Thiomonas sp.]